MTPIEQSVEILGMSFPVTPSLDDSGEIIGYVPSLSPRGPERLIERGGRVCYRSEDRITDVSAEGFVEMVCKRQHESVLEHSSITVRISSDIGVIRELLRHRHLSPSQASTRYINYTKDKNGGGNIRFLHPLYLTPEQLAFSIEAYAIEEGLYNKAIALGMKPEEARDYLPLGTETEVVLTGNFRAWAWVLSQRLVKPAHPKMRVLAKLLWKAFNPASPTVFNKEKFANLCADLE